MKKGLSVIWIKILREFNIIMLNLLGLLYFLQALMLCLVGGFEEGFGKGKGKDV